MPGQAAAEKKEPVKEEPARGKKRKLFNPLAGGPMFLSRHDRSVSFSLSPDLSVSKSKRSLVGKGGFYTQAGMYV